MVLGSGMNKSRLYLANARIPAKSRKETISELQVVSLNATCTACNFCLAKDSNMKGLKPTTSERAATVEACRRRQQRDQMDHRGFNVSYVPEAHQRY